MVQIGDTLHNGATVLAVHQDNRKTVVGCHWERDDSYVTWLLDKDGNAYWGHYYRDPLDMYQDFTARCSR